MNGKSDPPKEVSIHIGEYFGSAEPVIIKTILGSCVAVCLFDPVKKIGAMNHILLSGRADMKHFDASARYGINAMELLINRMLSLGADRRRFVAKAFGGAHILPGISIDYSPGRKISEFVTEFLETESIPLVGCNLGGDQSRQVHFYTRSGDAFVRCVPSAQTQSVRSEEEESLIRSRQAIKKPGGITLF